MLKVVRQLLAFAVLFGALTGAAYLPPKPPTIRPDHPKLFFNRETWPAVKSRAMGEAKADLDRLLKLCDSYPEKPVCSGTEPAPPNWSSATPLPPVREWGSAAARCALAWRFTGKEIYLEKAKRMLLVSVEAYNEACRNRRAVDWYSTSRILALCAYDWIYEALTNEERRSIIVPLVEHIENVQPAKDRPPIVRLNPGGVKTGFYGVFALLWYSGVVAGSDGFCDDLARRHLERGYELARQMLEFRDKTSGDDGALSCGVAGYSMGEYPWAHFNFFHTVRSAAGIDAAALYPGIALFPNWIWWNWIESDFGALQFGFGDTRHETNQLPLYTLYEHMTQYAYFWRYTNPAAAKLAMTLRERAPKQDLGRVWPMYPFISTDVDDVKPYTKQELMKFPIKARHFESTGQFVMRSAWTPDSTYCMFTAGGDVTMHRHYDENNFVIYRKGFLALDSGSRAYQTDHNLTYYYSQTVAHNCMLVHKPKEPLPGYWGVKYSGEEGKYSYGGQGFQKASVLAFETKPGFTYIASDATKSYSGKCSEAIRQFLWVSPDLFVVYDRVETLEPTYAKEWLLHTANEPEITASLSRASAGESVMYLQTILPENALIRKVGGKGKEFLAAGRNWELAPEFVNDARRRCEKDGHGPWFGQWRLEVAPSKLEKSNRFLNVINVGDVTSCRPLSCQLLRHANMEGVKIRLEPNKAKGVSAYVELSVLFNCSGKVGGNLHIRQVDNTGKLLREKKHVFTQDVAPQSGVENDF